MQSDPNTARRTIKSRIKQVLSEFGLECAEVGGKFDELRQTIDPDRGYWADPSFFSKPSRLLVHLSHKDDKWNATLPPDNENGTFAYANTQGKRAVGGLIVRVVPVFALAPSDYRQHLDWEWLLWYCFSPKLSSGSSGEVFDAFNPTAGTFLYRKAPQPYVAAGLVKLCPGDDRFQPSPDYPPLTYDDATEAIRKLIHVNPSISSIPENTTEQ